MLDLHHEDDYAIDPFRRLRYIYDGKPVSGDSQLTDYLWAQYRGVFDEAQMERHIQDYIGMETAEVQVEQVRESLGTFGAQAGKAAHVKVLDVGSGFGSFVVAARKAGFDALGVEIESFEVDFARKRLRSEMPAEDAESAYMLGDGRNLPFDDEVFDAVTLWNVLEHVDDLGRLISEVNRVLRPSGIVLLVCPNYAAFREEAHYHVFWPSLVPRGLAAGYLRLRGKDPSFFQNAIYYRTNREVIRALKLQGLTLRDNLQAKVADPDLVRSDKLRRALTMTRRFHMAGLLSLILKAKLYNPLKHSVVITAQKGAN